MSLIIFAALLIVLIFASEFNGFLSGAIIALLLASSYHYDVITVDLIRNNMWAFLSLFVLYIIVGICYATSRWYFYVIRQSEKILEKYNDCFRNPKDKTEARLAEFKKSYPPVNIMNHYDSFMLWMAYWPVNIIYKFLSFIFLDLFDTIFRHLKASLQKISNNAYAKIKFDDNDFGNPHIKF